MGRWTQYDEDEYRLPEGMKRVGYDSDSGRYHFRDADGALWEGPEGAQFGEMTKVTNAPAALDVEDDGNADVDVEAVGMRRDGYQPLAHGTNTPLYAPSSPYRTIFPFFLIIATCLLLVWRIFLSPTPPPAGSTPSPTPPLSCSAPNEPYEIRLGDTCWEIAQARSVSVDALKTANSGLACDRLRPGQRICAPAGRQRRR